jgi:hypothetical protein
MIGAAVVTLLFTLQGAAAANETQRRCGRGDYSLEVNTWRPHGKILVAVGIVTDKMSSCTLKGSARVALSYRHGKIAVPLRGNPARWRVSTTLKPWSQLVHTWTWRNWCHPTRQFAFRVSLNGEEDFWNGVGQPLCRDRHSKSRLIDSGSGTRFIPFTSGRIPAHILSPDVPPPLSPALIRVSNAWLVSDGRTLVAVYAGEAGGDPTVGRFSIIRQNYVFGFQKEDLFVDAGQTGALRITDAPKGAAVETSAQRGEIAFSSTSGAEGVLHLADDSVELTR